MRMPLHDLAAGLQGCVVERVGELAEAAPDGGNETALLQRAAGREAAAARRPSQLGPEAEGLSGIEPRAV